MRPSKWVGIVKAGVKGHLPVKYRSGGTPVYQTDGDLKDLLKFRANPAEMFVYSLLGKKIYCH